MTTQPHPTPDSVAAASLALSGKDASLTPEQKAAKALKKERKHERLRFFFGWCQGCKAFGSGF